MHVRVDLSLLWMCAGSAGVVSGGVAFGLHAAGTERRSVNRTRRHSPAGMRACTAIFCIL